MVDVKVTGTVMVEDSEVVTVYVTGQVVVVRMIVDVV
jgi:hypothetical protein